VRPAPTFDCNVLLLAAIFSSQFLHPETCVRCRKGVIEYNSREEMDDAIRKLDNTRVGDRGENLIRVYKVCSGGAVLCLLRCRVALTGVWLRSSAA
jgi:hypothetical protein